MEKCLQVCCLIFHLIYLIFEGVVARMNMIRDTMKMEVGHWLISSSRDGGYAYAKVRSNGKNITLSID